MRTHTYTDTHTHTHRSIPALGAEGKPTQFKNQREYSEANTFVCYKNESYIETEPRAGIKTLFLMYGGFLWRERNAPVMLHLAASSCA